MSDVPITTVRDFEFQPPTKPSKVPATRPLQPLGDPRIVRIAINVWMGWSSLVLLNEGKAPKRIWTDSKGKPFQVELVVEEDWQRAVAMVAQGSVHASWGTVDLLPLITTAIEDANAQPRVFQVVDWSRGGDGIVARSSLAQVGDLRGKKIVTSQFTPSYYFLASTLRDAGLSQRDVDMRFTRDSFQAIAAFDRQTEFQAAVSWQPDVDSIGKKGGNRVMLTTHEASRAIAGTWYTRADFAKAHPEIVEALVRGILEAGIDIEKADRQAHAMKLLEDLFKLPAGTAQQLWSDGELAGLPENRAFFDAKQPAGFAATYRAAAKLYREIGLVDASVESLALGDGSVIEKLASDPVLSKQSANVLLAATPVLDFGKRTILTRTIADDPLRPESLADVATIAGRFASTHVELGVHEEAALQRDPLAALALLHTTLVAHAMRKSLVDQYALAPAQLVAKGHGASTTANKNRRVEIRVHAVR